MKKVLICLFFCSSLLSQDLILVKEKINKILPEGVSVKEITYSQERDIFIVDIGDIQPIYVLPNTEYIILGDIFSLKGDRPESETEKDKGRLRLKILADLDQDSFIKFKSYPSPVPSRSITLIKSSPAPRLQTNLQYSIISCFSDFWPP